MKIPFSEDEINKATVAAAKAQNIVDGYIRPVVFRGSERMSVAAPDSKIHVAIAAWHWGAYFPDEHKRKGIRMTVAEWRRPSPETAPWKSKAAGLYMIATLSKHAAEEQGFQDALMLDYRNLIAEATGANVFFVESGKLVTPIADCFLDGITRRTIIDLARARQIPVIERHIEPSEMADFEECFLTGTAAELTPVGSIGDYTFTPGRITMALHDDYHALVRQHLSAEKRAGVG
jgi:branched-chain amino acid aminotransferase